MPSLEVCAPGYAKGSIAVEIAFWLSQWARTVKEHQITSDSPHTSQIDDGGGCDTATRPFPLLLSQDDKGTVVAPMQEVSRTLHANAILGRVKENILAIVDQHTNVFVAVCPSVGSPVRKVMGVRHTDAILLVEAPPFSWLILILNQIRVYHPPHGRDGNISLNP